LRGEAVHPTGATSSAQPQTQSPQSEIPALSGPAPSLHTPLPTTSAEFVQQVLAGQNSSRPPQASLGPGREPGSAAPKPALQSPTTPPARGPVSDHSPTSAAQPAPSSPSNPQPPHSTLLNNSRVPNPIHQSPLRHPPRGKNLGQPLVPRLVHPAFPFWHLFPRGSRERPRFPAPPNSFTINTYRNARKC
jgi:hypothetical protein